MKSVLIHIKIMKHLLPIESSYPNQKHMRYVFRSWPHQTSFRVTPLLFTYTCTLHHVFEHRVCICMCVYTIYEYDFVWWYVHDKQLKLDCSKLTQITQITNYMT